MELGNKQKQKGSMSIQALDRRTKDWFARRGIKPTLREYHEVAACIATGVNPLGIH